MTEDQLFSVNLIHSVHEWTQVGPHDQVAGERVMPHLTEVVVVAAAAPLLQVEEGAEGAEHSQMKEVVVGAEEHFQMKVVEEAVEGVEQHSQMKVVEEEVEGAKEHSQMKVAEGAAAAVVVVVMEEEGPHMKVEVAKH